MTFPGPSTLRSRSFVNACDAQKRRHDSLRDEGAHSRVWSKQRDKNASATRCTRRMGSSATTCSNGNRKTPRRQHQGLSPFIITVVYRSAQMTLPTWLWKTIVIVTGLVLLGKLTENHGLYHSTTMVFTIQYVFVPVNVPTNPRLFGAYPNPTAAIKLALCLIPQS